MSGSSVGSKSNEPFKFNQRCLRQSTLVRDQSDYSGTDEEPRTSTSADFHTVPDGSVPI